ncbi:MAG TPA: GRP family sugar transporter [Bryobacteraceae bacterium]|nr:GRP family sugar transporter [Bryobacteraceae bacterium]
MPKWRLEYFYLDYAFGFLITGLAIGATFGSTASLLPGSAFLVRLVRAAPLEAFFAMSGGFLWSLGNVLMVNSIMIAGLAVAFPVTSIPAMVLGVGIAYWTQPIGNPLYLSASVVVLLLAGFANARAYGRLGNPVETDKPKGIKLALLAGIMVGIFPPCVGRAITGVHALDSYTVSIYFMIGALAATLVAVPLLLAHPLVGEIGRWNGYWHGKRSWHVLGLLAGFVWSFGTMFNFLSAKTVGMAISWGIGSGANMVGALWGIFLWREFAHGDSRAKVLIAISLALYVAGVTGVALAYNGS